MTIVTPPLCFVGFPRRAIDPALVERALGAAVNERDRSDIDRLLFRLNVYLDLTGRTLSDANAGTPKWTEIWTAFAGALASGRLGPHDKSLSRHFRVTLEALGDTDTAVDWTYGKTFLNEAGHLAPWIASFRDEHIGHVKADFWSGWVITNKRDAPFHLRLYGMFERLGPEFTTELVDAASTYFRTRSLDQIDAINALSEFVAAYPPPLDTRSFRDSEWLEIFVTQFMVSYFTAGAQAKHNLTTIHARWGWFCDFMEGHVLGRIWGSLIHGMPRPRIKKPKGAHLNVRTSASGELVKAKLITEVPLEITDHEALQRIWDQIRSEVDSIVRWARSEADAAWQRHLSRLELEDVGVATVPTPKKGPRSGKRKRVTRENPDYPAHAAATFKAYGFNPSDPVNRPEVIYADRIQTAWDLGLPSREVLVAHAALLIEKYPCITCAYLKDLQLFDDRGRLNGYRRLGDAGWCLSGLKRRRGAELAQMDVPLDSEANELVRRLIKLTEPLRQYLRRSGNDDWRYLFLSAHTMGAQPTRFMPDQNCNVMVPWLTTRLEEMGLAGDVAHSLATRFTLTRLRASCGALVYFESESVDEMAKALGHARHSAALLDHYLPRPLQDFFVERWIRIMQEGLVCEAMKDSELLLEVSTFQSMKQLNTFLTNHAIKHLPAHLVDPDCGLQDAGDTASDPILDSKIVFSISPSVLRCLLEVQKAVHTATGPVGTRARRWCGIADRLIPHIEQDDVLASILRVAERLPAPANIEDLILD
ncbi:hypothetical protein [Lysobacter sp. FW306-1B-D06B]|uniref:hypothetical protein n=1 Tax=Lysobacter sp. FW306-1B-D06B TaxID=3140250 RepID=UPI00313FF1DA